MVARSRKPRSLLRPVVPDKVDLRDRPYRPAVATAPPARLAATDSIALPVLDQAETAACTGFALANVVNFLLRRSKRELRAAVSPFMLYSMARRYDEFPGARADVGSSLRGAMKGWYRHGACAASLWSDLEMPDPHPDPRHDWWQDAARRPLGAYYRVDTRSVADMHAALNEVGVLYASALCHAGWDEGFSLPVAKRRGWVVPARRLAPSDGGHAFVIVGYDAHGFQVLNSWGEDWGDGGIATLPYEDWLEHAMDCWVAQLGVVTEQHEAVAASVSLRTGTSGRVTLASLPLLRQREIAPFIVNMENNGNLSTSGKFRTTRSDLQALFDIHLEQARRRWGLGKRGTIDVALYAHGGLTGEDGAAETAARWIPALYDAQILPIFLMWETDLLSTLENKVADVLADEPRATAGMRDTLSRWWNTRLERAFAGPGTFLWDEMKQNATAIGTRASSGIRQLFDLGVSVPGFAPSRVRLHLIGHSAGAILHCHLADALVRLGWKFASVHFMAPAVRTDVFESTLLPHLVTRQVGRYHQFHLNAGMEERDPTCRPLLGYGRSLLYLVSESFEGGRRADILGLERDFDVFARRLSRRDVSRRVRAFAAPSSITQSTTHGGFDDDDATRRTILALVKGRNPGRA